MADTKGMSTLAAKPLLHRENLYQMLSKHGNPQLDSFTALLGILDLHIAVVVKYPLPTLPLVCSQLSSGSRIEVQCDQVASATACSNVRTPYISISYRTVICS
jgi:hypothetical protein